ncbi:MAG: terminase, partial [Candidatus Thorarchaeota archaeon]
MRAEEIERLYEGLSFDEKQEIDRMLAADMKKVIWRPLVDPDKPNTPTPQMQAYTSRADILLFGGQAGGGKTGLLAGLSLTEHQRTVIYRREIKQAAAIAEEIIRFRRTRDGYNGQDKIFRLDGNRIIQLAGMQYDSDKQKFKGVPFDLIAFDEVTDFLESQFRFVITWNRAVNPEQRCRVIATCNPPTTAEGRWIVSYFAPWLDPYHPNPALPGELRYFTTDAKGHDTERPDGEPFE